MIWRYRRANHFAAPRTCCGRQFNSGTVLSPPGQTFRVICVSYDGFDEMEQAILPDMPAEAAKWKNMYKQPAADISAPPMAASLGGSLVGLLICRPERWVEEIKRRL